MSTARGRGSTFVAGIQSDFQTAGSASPHILPFYTENFVPSEPLASDNELGVPLDNPYDQTDPAPSLKGGTGGISVPADMNSLILPLCLLLGTAPDPTGDDPYVRAWTSGAEPVFGTMQFATATSRWKIAEGVGFSSWDFDLGKSEGYRQMNFSGLCRDLRIAALTANRPFDPSAITMPARAKAVAASTTLSIGGSPALRVTGGRFSYQNGLSRTDYLDGSPLASDMERDGETQIRLNPTIRMAKAQADNGLLDYFAGADGTPFAVELAMTIDSGSKLVITLPRCFGERTAEPVSGPGALEVSPNIWAAQSSGAPAMTVTLTNAIEEFA